MAESRVFIIVLLLTCCVDNILNYEIRLSDLSDSGFRIGTRFIGTTIDSSIIRTRFGSLNFQSPKLQTLAKGLTPSYFRMGGTDCDFLIFNPNLDTTLKYIPSNDRVTHTNFTMTAENWDYVNMFVKEVGWDLIFDFNVFLRQDGKWNPANAIELLQYSLNKGFNLAGFELGNELDVFKDIIVTAEEVVPDFAHLREILSNMAGIPPFLLLGPDTGTVQKISDVFMFKFFNAGGGASIDIATWHHYYMDSRLATVDLFHNVTVLESLRPLLMNAVSLCQHYIPNKPVWLGETSSSYGGGAQNISDRYVASFLWLDKLGLSASLGIQGVLRQTFYGGNYGLVNYTLDPNPDYWITLLYKRLVGSIVLDVTKRPDLNLRLYGHCSNTNSSAGYKKGSVTLYFMNLGSETIPFTIPDLAGKSIDAFIFSPGIDNDLTSRAIRLNGDILSLTNEDELPPFKPIKTEAPLGIQGYTMGFFVVPDAMKQECL